jgi:hypothetical protein
MWYDAFKNLTISIIPFMLVSEEDLGLGFFERKWWTDDCQQ